jgi:glutamate-1-semialdehyde 2,1-aminomutase
MLHTPGDSQTRSKAFGSVGPQAVYPPYAESGSGCRVTCSDGSKVIDLVAGLGAISLGYGDAGVTKAVGGALALGSILSLPHRLENEVATLLSEVIPCAEMTRFVMTGSEAMQGAVQIARSVTKRSNLVVADSSYHGWHEWFQSQHRQPILLDGTDNPEDFADCYAVMGANLETFRCGDIDNLQRKVTSRTAAIIIEPFRFPVANTSDDTSEAQRRFYGEARRLADTHGALLIFDEMIFGFRHALGGSQELWCDSQTIPDIACFGKALGNGVPIAAICGTRDVMEEAQLVSSTFGGSLLGLSAAKEVITRYRTESISERMWERGHVLREAFHAEAKGTPTVMEGYPVHFRLAGLTDKELDSVLAQSYQEGILLHRACGNIIASMTSADAVQVGRVLGQSVVNVCEVKMGCQGGD